MPTAPTFGAVRSDIAPLGNVDFGSPQSAAGLVSAGQALQGVGHVLDEQYKSSTNTRADMSIQAYKNEVDDLQMKLQGPEYRGVNANKVFDVISEKMPQIRSKYQGQLGDNADALKLFNQHSPLIDQRFQSSTDNFVRVQNHDAALSSAKTSISMWSDESIRNAGAQDPKLHEDSLTAMDQSIERLGKLQGLPADAVEMSKDEARGNIYANVVNAKIDLKQYDEARTLLKDKKQYMDPKVVAGLDGKLTGQVNYDNALKAGDYAMASAKVDAGVPNIAEALGTIDRMKTEGKLDRDQVRVATAQVEQQHGLAVQKRNVQVADILNGAVQYLDSLQGPPSALQRSAAMEGYVAHNKVMIDQLFTRQDHAALAKMIGQADDGLQDQQFNDLMAMSDKQVVDLAQNGKITAEMIGSQNYNKFMSRVNNVRQSGVANDTPDQVTLAADKAFKAQWLMSGGKIKEDKPDPIYENGRKVFVDRINRIRQASPNGVLEQKTIDAQAASFVAPNPSETRTLPLVPIIREGGTIVPSGRDDMSQLFRKILGSNGDRREAAATVKQWVEDANTLGAYNGQRNSLAFTNALVESFVGASGNKSAVVRTKELRESVMNLHPELTPDQVDKLVIDLSVERTKEPTTASGVKVPSYVSSPF